MNITVMKSYLSGAIDILPSKSHLHRLLIACALSKNESVIKGVSSADDILATIACLNALGAEIKAVGNSYHIKPIIKPVKNAVLDCGESGSTLRFLLPVATALGGGAEFRMSERLAERPIKGLLDCLKSDGITVNENPLMISGELREDGIYNIDATVSSQYISGLLLALPLVGGEILFEGIPASKNYIDITLEVINSFGVTVEEKSSGFVVHKTELTPPSAIISEGDWSNAAFWLAAGALCGEITVKGLNLSSPQGDKKIFGILKDMGADIAVNGNSVTAKKSALRAINIDAGDIPDLVPIISVLCATAEGKSVISNIERLRDKESDRILAILSLLTSLGVLAWYDDSLQIVGGTLLGGAHVSAYNDHRIAMSAAVAGAASTGTVRIHQAGAVKKSYPNFFEVFAALGGKWKYEIE